MTLNRKTFLASLAAITLVRVVLAYWIPIKNDEAYYVLWAQNLDDGYYDHPPLVGWLVWLFSHVSGSVFWLRTIPVVAALVATWGVYRFSKDYWGTDRARFAALLFALSPSSVWMLFISNDAPLLIFITFSVLFFFKAIKESRYVFSLTSGILLGLAFLTKYLAVIVGIGFLVFALLDNRKSRLRHLGLVLAGVLPFAVQHILYNYHNCWNTVSFHLFVRNADTSFSVSNFFSYVIGLVFVLTPWGLWYLSKHRKKLPYMRQSLLIVVSLVSIAIFGLISFKSIIGLHFLLIFSPFVFVYFGVIDNLQEQKRMLAMSSIYAVVVTGILFVLLAFPLQKMEGWEHHSNFVVGLAPEKICDSLDKYADAPLFTNYYAQAGILSYACERNIQVLFGMSNYGRQMDAMVDVSKLDGKDIVVFEPGEINPDNYSDYFDEYRVERFSVYNAPFSVIMGKRFKYSLYKTNILSKIKRMYYTPPAWLPSGGCPFSEKYFSGE